MTEADPIASTFVAWFKRYGSQHEAVGLTSYPGMGRGAVALQDIPAETVLFSIPRTLLLNTGTSKLPSLLSEEERQSLTGWTPLILSMIWEHAQGEQSLWKKYFDIMPEQFDSLMFWSQKELDELKGSAILSKIGKEQATADYHNLIAPLVKSRPDLFSPSSHYSEVLYNQMGSLILSRSFHVEEGSEDGEEQAEGSQNGDTSMASSSKADDSLNVTAGMQSNADGDVGEDEDDDDDEDEEDQEDVAHVSMVPWADMLNARHGCDNARLFYEKDCLNMCSTKEIKAGEPIWNVYGDPPNSDLLRRYGHVDPHNPSDIAEITADLIADVACQGNREERIEFLLEAELDDTYVFTIDDTEEEMEQYLAAISVFSADAAAFSKMQKKGRVSRKGLADNLAILRLGKDILERRVAQYPWSFEEDEAALADPEAMPLRLKDAMIVRHGEMKILRQLIADLQAKIPAESAAPESDGMAVDAPEPGPAKSRILSKKEQREEKKRQREEEKLMNDQLGGKKQRRKG